MTNEQIGTRYNDAYFVARTVNRIGQTIKTIGVIGGIAIPILSIVFTLLIAKESRGDAVAGIAASIIFYLGTAFGVIFGSLFYILGILIASQGQILTATLDGSVNTSPFLSDEERRKIMSMTTSAGTTAKRKAAASTDWQCDCGQINYEEKSSCVRCGKQAVAA